jgi:hypothetical protein
MEPGFYLTTLVFAVAVLHLLNRTVTSVARFLAASGLRSNESRDKPGQRDDWYMFFHRSDLIGKPKKKDNTSKINMSIRPPFSEKQKRCDSRPVLRRHLT